MKVYIGADHNGFDLKAKLSDFVRQLGHDVVDEGDGTLNLEDDFPHFATRVVTLHEI